MLEAREIQFLRWYEQVVFEKETKKQIEKKREKDSREQQRKEEVG